MRIKVGKLVDADKDVNLLELSPIDRIIAAGVNAYHSTGMYKRRFAESEERKQEQLRRIRESLIDNLVILITAELEHNTLLAQKKDLCKAILVEVPEKFRVCLKEAIQSHEFDAYDIYIVPPNKMLAKFAHPPFLLYICNKGD